MSKWNLGRVYDLTQYFNDLVKANKICVTGNIYENGYYVCHDVWDTHIYRIQIGINAEYETEPRTKIIEQNDISHGKLVDYCIENYGVSKDIKIIDERAVVDFLINILGLEKVLKAIVELDYEDGFENYDVTEFRYDAPLEQLIEYIIDGGYGISKIEMSV